MAVDRRPSGTGLTRVGYVYTWHDADRLGTEARLEDLLRPIPDSTVPYRDSVLIEGMRISCDSVYGYAHGYISQASGRWKFIVEQPDSLRRMVGTELYFDTGLQHWAIIRWETNDGSAMPPPYAVPPEEVAPAATAAVIPPPPTPTVVTPAQDKIIVKQRSILEQAMDEGYNPICKDSKATGLQRPSVASPTQILAYLVSCSAVDKDLAVNEMDLLLDDKEKFFNAPWPEYKESFKGDLAQALIKVG
jgi:hypothetical protein